MTAMNKDRGLGWQGIQVICEDPVRIVIRNKNHWFLVKGRQRMVGEYGGF